MSLGCFGSVRFELVAFAFGMRFKTVSRYELNTLPSLLCKSTECNPIQCDHINAIEIDSIVQSPRSNANHRFSGKDPLCSIDPWNALVNAYNERSIISKFVWMEISKYIDRIEIQLTPNIKLPASPYNWHFFLAWLPCNCSWVWHSMKLFSSTHIIEEQFSFSIDALYANFSLEEINKIKLSFE